MSRPTLVTGATGGLGLALVAALSADGREIVAIGRRETEDPRLKADGVHYVRADLTDRTLAEITTPAKIGTVFHCAALSSPWGPRGAFRAANVEATRNLLRAAEARGAEAFIHVSTPSIYADFHDRPGIVEDDPPADPPLNDYARTKLEAERLVLAHEGRMATVAIRPRAIVGPDDTVVLPRLAAMVRKGRIPLIGGGRAKVEFTDVRDVVAAMLAAERHADRARGKAVNVSGGRPVAVRDAALALANALGVETRTVDVPMPLARMAATFIEAVWPRSIKVREPALTRYIVATLAHDQTFDLTRARTLLGWTPVHDGLATLLAGAEALR